jgi:hypothetical protein
MVVVRVVTAVVIGHVLDSEHAGIARSNDLGECLDELRPGVLLCAIERMDQRAGRTLPEILKTLVAGHEIARTARVSVGKPQENDDDLGRTHERKR